MIHVMLVDDEILALEYLKNIVDWEAYGYHIAGTAVNGRKALELYAKTAPEIVITDIKMAGMDGLELARQLKEKNPDVIVIFLSAYRDFEYAQKGIRYGVSNYLLKHELCRETLLEKLKKIERKLDLTEQRKKMHQKYLVNQLIHAQSAGEQFSAGRAGEKFFLSMVHKRSQFCSGEFIKADWDPAEARILEDALPQIDIDGISYAADAPITSDNWIILCRMEHTPSMQASDDRTRHWAEKLMVLLNGASSSLFHVICSRKIEADDIGQVFRLMSRQACRSFWEKPNTVCFLEAVPAEKKVLWGEQLQKLERAVYEEDGAPGGAVRQLLQQPWEEQGAEACRSLLLQMNNLLQEIAARAGAELEASVCASMDEVIRYYEARFEEMHACLRNQERARYSRVVAEAVSYIRRNYKRELSLEILGAEFHMNGVYLGQIFKKEVGTTVLKYQTALRMEEAKRLLREENCTVSEAARLVGYQTSQYFSQIFARSTGKKPQEYRRNG